MKQFLFFLLLGVLFTSGSFAKTNASVKEVIESSFQNVSAIETKSLILSSEQFKKVRSYAKTSINTKVYRYYNIKSNAKDLGKAVLITRKVRSKKATVLYAFDNTGTLRFSEIMAFGEPPEYIPSSIWMEQLKKQKKTAKLTLGKDIPTISGSTLSARSITEGARVARAIFETVLKLK
ncbi:MAG: FMN-binding protein [Sulfurovum sp.]|uniref:FMN-binding protein n=1 Tax=Sulfurovum sp. TaxID=1969726 RepID=UPI002867C28A|nr:FMN-binding protein [Sulfurovum sp.]MCO4846262.1 FMN-binding protein [Sulfurovum sp.]